MQWEEDARKHEAYLRNICEYPLVPEASTGYAPHRPSTVKALSSTRASQQHLRRSGSSKGPGTSQSSPTASPAAAAAPPAAAATPEERV